MIKAILAIGENGEIGQEGDMPWKRRLPKDLEYFKEQTLNREVFMGNTTFKSLPFKNGFPNRENSILSSRVPVFSKIGYEKVSDSVVYYNESYMRCILRLSSMNFSGNIGWLVGGATVYSQFWDYVSEVHLTRVKESFPEADTFFKPDLEGFERVGDIIDVSGDDLEAYVEVWRRV